MASYLPKDTNAGSAYQEGGGLYALGMFLFYYAGGGGGGVSLQNYISEAYF